MWMCRSDDDAISFGVSFRAPKKSEVSKRPVADARCYILQKMHNVEPATSGYTKSRKASEGDHMTTGGEYAICGKIVVG